MKSKLRFVLLLLFLVLVGRCVAQSPYTNSVFPAQMASASAQTLNTIQLNGNAASTIGSSFGAGTISVTGSALTTVTFSVMGSSDNGATFYALPIYTQNSPTTAAATLITATTSGLYQVSLVGLTQIKIVTSGTFTAASVSFVLTATPQLGLSSKSSSNGTVNSASAFAPAYYPADGTAVSGATPFTGPQCDSTTGAPEACTSSQLQAVMNALVPGSQALYLPYQQNTTTATTLTDYSGNGYTGTFDTTTHAPTWTANGYGILFRNVQDIQIPSGVLNGAKTIQMWFSLTSPGPGDTLGFNWLLTDGNSSGICLFPSWNGLVGTSTSGNCARPQGLNRYVGPSGIAFTYPSTTTNLQYINGSAVSGYDFNVGGATIAWNSTNPGYIGNYASNLSYGANFIFYGMAVYNTVLTPAQIAANDAAFRSTMQAATGVQFGPTYIPSSFYLVNGDSRYVNVGAGRSLVSDIPAISLKNLGIDDWVNYSVFGYQQVALAANIANVEYAILDGYGNGPKVVWDEAGINDIENSTTAATVLTSLQSYCSNLHTRYPGIRVGVNTLPPDTNSTSAQQTQLSTLNTNLVNAWVGGTLGCDGLIDEAGDPLAATQVTPNSYLPTGTATFNATYYLDGIHYTAALNTEIANGDSCYLADLVGRMNRPCWITRQIPFKVLGIFANTSQVVNLVQLGPGWQVCGVKENVSTAFTGTSITGLTATVGDSTGTATQYLASQSLLSTGGPTPYVGPNFLSTHGIVQATFASTGGNLSALTAGAMNIDVCVVDIP